MSKRGFVRGPRASAPTVTPVRVMVNPPLALPEREPRNILLMIAAPALLVGILGTLVVMYTSGVRSLQSGFFPMVGLVGFGALMFSGRFGRGRRVSWGEQEKQRRIYLRQLDEDRDEVQRAALQQRRSQLHIHGDPRNLDTIIGGPRMWERRPTDPDFLDARLGIGVHSTADSAVSLQWPDVPVGEELEPVTGRALRDFILEQSKIRDVGKVLSLRSRPGFSFVGDSMDDLHALARAVMCSLAVYQAPSDLKLMVVTRHPERWSWLVWLPHNHHDEMFDACGLRRLVFTSPGELEEALYTADFGVATTEEILVEIKAAYKKDAALAGQQAAAIGAAVLTRVLAGSERVIRTAAQSPTVIVRHAPREHRRPVRAGIGPVVTDDGRRAFLDRQQGRRAVAGVGNHRSPATGRGPAVGGQPGPW